MTDDEDTLVATITARLRVVFYLGLAVGVLVGIALTLLGVGVGWAVWHWWMA